MPIVDSTLVTRLLVVEDEAIVALDLRKRLEKLGYYVVAVVATGADAMLQARAERPTLALMDINIRGPIDGIETAKELWSELGIPVVFLTAYADTATIERAKEARPYGFLVKPFDERELSATIETAVFRHRSEGRARLLEQAIESASTATLIAHWDGHDWAVVLSNPAFEQLSGYPADAIAGKSPWMLEGAETDPVAKEQLRTAARDTRACQSSMILHRKDGHAFWSDVSLSFVRDASGEASHALFFYVDATGRKEAEALVLQAQKEEGIGRLAGGVAHDFNNILAVIMGYSEMLQRQLGADHPARPRLDHILEAAQRASDLTRQLLAFSRRQVLRFVPLDLNAVVGESHRMLDRLIGEDINVVIRRGSKLGTVKADPGQVSQVIMNLALNARDAMPKGGTLTIETRNADIAEAGSHNHLPLPEGRYVVLVVTDTGTGISRETQARMFEPFFTTKAVGDGTGMGLATVQGIVRQSGGHVRVDSAPDQGTTFTIYFPRVDPVSEDKTATAKAETRGGSETLLLAEDQDSLRHMLQETLEAKGYRVLPASNGSKALELAKDFDGPIHLLLTDVVMPELGGGDLAAALLKTRPDLRVIYMSGYADGALSHQGVLSAGVTLIEKPFAADDLARAVRASLDAPPAPERNHP